MTIHKEGYQILFWTALILLGVNVLSIFYLFTGNQTASTLILIVSLVLFFLVLQFFRKPRRNTPLNDKHIISPCDGTVVVIEEVNEPEYFKGQRRQVSIFMSPLNVHINFHPVTGTVKYVKYYPGKYLVAWHPKSSTENERTSVVIKAKNGAEILLRQIAGALARRIVWYAKEGQQVEQGHELGFIKFGSRVDLFLPLDAEVKVKIGEKTKGGVTVVADL
ncbi:phosphatidylserine decarboxylase family protein [Larkinella humicola]|uniref:Phosphatidylserine decarboxylase proenzyme n=1 Tax=Larkinella humicola TaxID=2607654 RepID=A0A5N1JG28_9BACT|nr:phosphatidylserine decarboxylase family protein [Larkinella humicola]KAA9353992.1 phosphatidylserine decarboxylase family protein [Larkinella humicola]